MKKNIVLLMALVFVLCISGEVRADEEKVNVCHVPPGNAAKARVIFVDPYDVEDHLAHGDNLGACCPCWVHGNKPGGIDYQIEELAMPTCGTGPAGVFARGFRSGEDIDNIWAIQATSNHPTEVDKCILIDEVNGIEVKVVELTAEENAVCLEILLESQRWALDFNCEEPI